jgi:hypothetical protein
MGCDIHTFVEVFKNGKWNFVVFKDGKWNFVGNYAFNNGYGYTKSPFDWRSYGMFGFLAGVRNYSCVPPISGLRGWPNDMSRELSSKLEDGYCDYHSPSYLTVKELADFNYDNMFEDRRYIKQTGNFYDGAAVHEPGDGEMVTYRDFLGEKFFENLAVLLSILFR